MYANEIKEDWKRRNNFEECGNSNKTNEEEIHNRERMREREAWEREREINKITNRSRERKKEHL